MTSPIIRKKNCLLEVDVGGVPGGGTKNFQEQNCVCSLTASQKKLDFGVLQFKRKA